MQVQEYNSHLAENTTQQERQDFRTCLPSPKNAEIECREDASLRWRTIVYCTVTCSTWMALGQSVRHSAKVLAASSLEKESSRPATAKFIIHVPAVALHPHHVHRSHGSQRNPRQSAKVAQIKRLVQEILVQEATPRRRRRRSSRSSSRPATVARTNRRRPRQQPITARNLTSTISQQKATNLALLRHSDDDRGQHLRTHHLRPSLPLALPPNHNQLLRPAFAHLPLLPPARSSGRTPQSTTPNLPPTSTRRHPQLHQRAPILNTLLRTRILDSARSRRSSASEKHKRVRRLLHLADSRLHDPAATAGMCSRRTSHGCKRRIPWPRMLEFLQRGY